MKTMHRTVIVVLLWAASVPAQTTLTGTWHGRTRSSLDLVLELRAADGALTGTLTRNGPSSPITGGTVSKGRFTFNAALDGKMETFTGEIAADGIKVWLDREGSAAAVTFKRSERGLSGRWQGKTPSGFSFGLDLIATETTLTGTLTRNDEPVTIADGKVSNNTFTFKATVAGKTAAFTGELLGDEIRLWMDHQGPSAAAVLQRVVDRK